MNRTYLALMANTENHAQLPVGLGDAEIIVHCNCLVSNIVLYRDGRQILDMTLDAYLRMMKAKKWNYVFEPDLFTLFISDTNTAQTLDIKIYSNEDGQADIYIKPRSGF